MKESKNKGKTREWRKENENQRKRLSENVKENKGKRPKTKDITPERDCAQKESDNK